MVTGAAGLYGVHLVDLLVSRPEITKVTGIDNFSRLFLIDDPFLPNPALKSKFQLLKRDYRSLTPEAIDAAGVDAIVHLAAYVSIDESMEDPEKYFQNNERGAFELARTLLATKSKPLLVVASSPEVYGNPVYTPMDEDHPMYPRSFYAVSKLAAEKHCRVLYEWYKYPVVVVRNFNTFGENQNVWGYSAVIPAFIECALRGENLVVHGDGTQTRDFLYIGDAVKAYLAILLRGKELSGSVFNIGTGIETPIAKLAEIIRDLASESGSGHPAPDVKPQMTGAGAKPQMTGAGAKPQMTGAGAKPQIIFKPGRPGDLLALAADISRAKATLGWSPEYDLVRGLRKTIDWYRRVWS
jgi:nucleoside-diphosphate-sugar epimerase